MSGAMRRRGRQRLEAADAVTGRVAAVDVGTNSVRLLVAEAAAPLHVLHREMRITRLGAGVDATGRLDDAALSRTVAVLTDYAATWRALGADQVRIAATSAVRDAADRDRFFDAVRRVADVDAEVLTGAEEAATAFRGATSGVDVPHPCLVLDIGGGSTELVLGDTTGVLASTSRQLGCVRLTERTLHSNPPTPHQVEEARELAAAELAVAVTLVDPSAARALVGVAGTVTTLAALHLGLPSYDADAIHGTVLPLAAVEELLNRLAALTTAERAALGPMAAGREDVIVGGAVILAEALEAARVDAVVVSESDILDGLALSLL